MTKLSTIRRFPITEAAQRLQAAARRMRGAESGIAIVEFALILPILLTLWIGGVEVTQALSVDRRLNNLAASIGDIVARSKELTHAQIDDIFMVATGAMYPYSNIPVSMVITAIKVDADGAATVAWSRASGAMAARAVDEDVQSLVAEALRVPESQIIMSEVYSTYVPAVGYVLTGDIPLEERMFYVPRLIPAIPLCPGVEEGETCLS